MQKEFKKSDLRTGMIVTTRNGEKYLVLLDMVLGTGVPISLLLRKSGYIELSRYKDNLDAVSSPNFDASVFDIIKVEKTTVPTHLLRALDENISSTRVVWERSNIKEQQEELNKWATELEKILCATLGAKVKIDAKILE